MIEEIKEEQTQTKEIVNELKAENRSLKTTIGFMESRIIGLEKGQTQLKESAIEAQFRSMKQNLTFHGIPEKPGRENTKQVVMDFLVLYLKLDPTVFKWNADGFIWITRCHRFGQTGPRGAPRPIVAVFADGVNIVQQNTKHLAGTAFFVSTQLPPELNEDKRSVQPIYKIAKQKGRHPKFVSKGNAVIVDNVRYDAPKVPLCYFPIDTIIAKTPAMNILIMHPLTEIGNTFNSHVANVASVTEIAMAVSAIKHTMNGGTVAATHNMYAARIMKDGRMQEFTEDDGEYGGARSILREMQTSNIVNRVIVVSRWSSKELLGAKRFQMIAHCTRTVIHIAQARNMPSTSPPQDPNHTYMFTSPPVVNMATTQDTRTSTPTQRQLDMHVSDSDLSLQGNAEFSGTG